MEHIISNVDISPTVNASRQFGGDIGQVSNNSTGGNTLLTLDQVRFKGHVEGPYEVGGFIGLLQFASFRIQNSYSTGIIEAASPPPTNSNGFNGGLIGRFVTTLSRGRTTIEKSYVAHTISGGSVANQGELFGSIFRDNTTISDPVVTFNNVYYLTGSGINPVGTIASGLTLSGAASPKTEAELKKQNTFTGWDFTNIWSIQESTSFPNLKIED